MVKERTFTTLLKYMLLILVSLIILFPILWIVSGSLKSMTEVSSYPPRLIPSNIRFDNYSYVWKNTNILYYFRNTLILIIGNTVGTLLSSSLVAYPLARMEFKGKNTIFGIILATMMVPTTVTIIPQFILFRKFKWLNSFLPMIVPAFFAYPYNVFLFRQFFRSIPKSIDEAAYIDGCNHLQIFFRIMIPLSRSVFITIGLLSAIFWWNELFQPLIYIDSDKLKPLTLGAMTVAKTHGFVTMWNLQMTMSVIMIVPPIILYMFSQKHLVAGIKAGAVKG